MALAEVQSDACLSLMVAGPLTTPTVLKMKLELVSAA
jgi:hypothetical protein